MIDWRYQFSGHQGRKDDGDRPNPNVLFVC